VPRLAPQMNGTPCVMEHRLTLGTYERKQLEEVVDAYRRDKWLENIPNIVVPIAAIGIPVAIGITGYTVGMGVASLFGAEGRLKEMINYMVLNPLSGKSRDGLNGYQVWLSEDGSMLEVPHYARILGVGWFYAQYLNMRGFPSIGQAARHRAGNGRGSTSHESGEGYTEPTDEYWEAVEEAGGTGGGGGRRGD